MGERLPLPLGNARSTLVAPTVSVGIFVAAASVWLSRRTDVWEQPHEAAPRRSSARAGREAFRAVDSQLLERRPLAQTHIEF
jgi:hypothetical protein